MIPKQRDESETPRVKATREWLSFSVAMLALLLGIWNYATTERRGTRAFEAETENELDFATDLLGGGEPGTGINSVRVDSQMVPQQSQHIVLATRRINRAIIRDPENARAHRLHAIALLRQKKFAHAIREQRVALRLNHDTAEDYLILASMYMQAGMLHEAFWAYHQVSTLKPGILPNGAENFVHLFNEMEINGTFARTPLDLDADHKIAPARNGK